MKIIAGCATNKGDYHEKNQDRIICCVGEKKHKTLAVCCVCDGIGSLPMSEIAAEKMTAGIRRWFDGIIGYYPDILNNEDICDDLGSTIEELNELIYDYHIENNISIGCTMSTMLVVGNEYYIFHVGDSRIYLVDKNMQQLTKDEVVTKEKNGRIRKLLANYIAKNKNIWMISLSGKLEPGDLFIIGSDGLFNRLDINDVIKQKKYISRKSINKVCSELIDTVLVKGETDNVSCGIIYVKERTKLW